MRSTNQKCNHIDCACEFTELPTKQPQTKEVTIKAVQFENGHILIGVNNNKRKWLALYFVKADRGIIMSFSTKEMKEIYNYETL